MSGLERKGVKPMEDDGVKKPDIQADLNTFVMRNMTSATKKLLDEHKNIPINKQWKDSYPLLLAVSNNSEKMVRLLLENGAKPNGIKLKDKKLPTAKALKNGSKDILNILLEAGADPNTKMPFIDDMAHTLLSYAAARGLFKCAEVILKYKPNINTILDNKTTAIIQAARYNDIRMLKLLVDNGADVINSNAYIISVERGAYRCAKMLATHGANISGVNKNGDSPMIILAKAVNEKTSEYKLSCIKFHLTLLFSLGEDLRYINLEGVDLLCAAVESGNMDIINHCLHLGVPTEQKGLKVPAIKIAENNRNKPAIERLCECGANTDMIDTSKLLTEKNNQIQVENLKNLVDNLSTRGIIGYL